MNAALFNLEKIEGFNKRRTWIGYPASLQREAPFIQLSDL
jgi:hypothetical protein